MAAVSTTYYIGSLVGLALRLPAGDHVVDVAAQHDPDAGVDADAAAPLGVVPGGGLRRAPGRPESRPGGRPCSSSRCLRPMRLKPSSAPARFRWLVGPTPRVDSLRRMTIFIVVVAVGAPLLSSFPDAAAVHLLQGEEFALVMRRRLSSNIMTALALLPALLALFLHLARWVRHTRPRRWVEAVTLAVTLVAAAQFAASLRVVPNRRRADHLPSHAAGRRLAVPAVGGRAIRHGRRQPGPARHGDVGGPRRHRTGGVCGPGRRREFGADAADISDHAVDPAAVPGGAHRRALSGARRPGRPARLRGGAGAPVGELRARADRWRCRRRFSPRWIGWAGSWASTTSCCSRCPPARACRRWRRAGPSHRGSLRRPGRRA